LPASRFRESLIFPGHLRVRRERLVPKLARNLLKAFLHLALSHPLLGVARIDSSNRTGVWLGPQTHLDRRSVRPVLCRKGRSRRSLLEDAHRDIAIGMNPFPYLPSRYPLTILVHKLDDVGRGRSCRMHEL